MAIVEAAKLNKYVERRNLKALEWLGSYTKQSAQYGAWPLGREQNYVNLCKRRESEGSGMAQKL